MRAAFTYHMKDGRKLIIHGLILASRAVALKVDYVTDAGGNKFRPVGNKWEVL